MTAKLTAQNRQILINRALKGENVSRLCRQEGISRVVFYRWLDRYRRLGKSGLTPIKAGRRKKPISPDKRFKYTRLSPNARLKMVEEVLIQDQASGDVAEKYGVSRVTLYKWINRYQKALKENREPVLAPIKPKIERYFKQTPEKYEEAVLALVAQHPEYGVRRIVNHLPKVGKLPIVGHHGVQNVLRRAGLNTHEKRLIYARIQITPVSRGIGRVLLSAAAFFRLAPEKRTSFIRFTGTFLISIFTTIVILGLGYYIAGLGGIGYGTTSVGLIFAALALSMGSIFFLYSLKYYLTIAIVLSYSQQDGAAGIGGGGGRRRNLLDRILGGKENYDRYSSESNTNTGSIGLRPNLDGIVLKRKPYISIHIPFYNEENVVERAIEAATSFEYPEYEVILCDDSTDKTTDIIRSYQKKHLSGGERLKTTINHEEGWELTWVEVRPGVTLKHLHRTSRSGFKGGALNIALKLINPKTEFISVFDADFVPYPDSLTLFLKYFKAQNNMSEDYSQSKVAAVQGYQWHVLNKSENWITRGVRSEYSGSYVIERSGEEIYQGLKQISGSVYMIRRAPLEEIGWGTSITEDFELTLKLYDAGYKVVYTPYIQAPAECVSTLKRFIRQRMRWAEGHSFNIKKMFVKLITNPKLSRSEKFEFLYLSPYYLQAFFFLAGTMAWLISETIFKARLPFWTSLWGWSLVLTNMVALPLMNAVGMFLEESEEKDYMGLMSFVVISYIMVPFQAFAAVKGFLEPSEGTWFRTPKTGKITDVFTRGRFYRFIQGILPGKIAPIVNFDRISRQYLALSTANNQFNSFSIKSKGRRWIGKAVISLMLAVSVTVYSFTYKVNEVKASIVNNFYLAATSTDEDSGDVSALYNSGGWQKQGSAVASTDTVLTGTNTTFWWYSRQYPTETYDATIAAGTYTFNPYKIASGSGATTVFIYTPEVGYCTGGCNESGDYTVIATGGQVSWARSLGAGLRTDEIGTGGDITFTAANKGRLYLKLTVTTNTTTYGMGYNGTSANYITNLQTPNLTIPENVILLLMVVPFIPFIVKALTNKNKTKYFFNKYNTV